MGNNTIPQLIDIVEDLNFKQILESQLREYKEISDIANNKIQLSHKEAKGIGTITKLKTYIMININTIRDKTPSHIAEMMIQGSTMGIIDLTKRLKEYDDAKEDISQLANRLLKFEQQNVEEMKRFLGS